MILKEVLEKSTNYLKAAGFETPRLDCELMFSHALSMTRIDLYLKFDSPLSEAEKKSCRDLLKRRHAGEPVSYITNKKEFFGISFYVDKNVLIPRPETEFMIEKFIEVRPDKSLPYNMFDFGCGSGCIGLSVLSNYPNAKLNAYDISEGAIEVSLKNSKNLDLSDRSEFYVQSVNDLNTDKDLCHDKVTEQVADVIFANPPYIDPSDKMICENVKKYEPALALFSEEEGFLHIKSWINKSLEILKPDGILLMEIGANQGEKTLGIIQASQSFKSFELIKDYQQFDRILYAVKK